MTISNKQKVAPREFILISHYSNDFDRMKWNVHDSATWLSNGIEEAEEIKVIEHSAFLELEQKLAKAVATLKVCALHSKRAKQTLEELGESEVGEG